MAIEIVSQNDCLIVDSRLIAGELGIEHRALRQTIEKYIDEIQEFGVVAFQMSKPLEGGCELIKHPMSPPKTSRKLSSFFLRLETVSY
jgi:phage regulator Rha-like protein